MASEQALIRSEEAVKSAREAAEASTKASLEAISKAYEINKTATETAAAWTKASQEVMSRAEEANRMAKEAADIAARATREATEGSRKAAKEAAEASIKVFEKFMAGTGGIGISVPPVTAGTLDIPTTEENGKASDETADALAETPLETHSETEETAEDENYEEADEGPALAFGEVNDVTDAEIDEKGDGKKVSWTIKNRLESLERMFSSSQDRPASREDEEEEE
jgi:hypothetical protein